MPQTIYTLIYTSLPSHMISEPELTDLLDTARVFNAAHGITGLLVYTGARFIQLLEGEQEVVQELYKRILMDKRHHSIVRVFDAVVEKRCFADWGMGYRLVDDAEAPFKGLSPEELVRMQESKPELVLGLMQQLAAA